MNQIISPVSLRQIVRVAFVGHVDSGKSTLIGRMLHDTNSLPDGKIEAVRRMCERRGIPLEYAFVLDALQAERDQGITIDTAQTWLRTPARDVVLIDAPGHKEFLKNMVTGAAQADAALLLIDAHQGISEQTRRHAYLLRFLGLDQIVVVVNKIDRIGYDEIAFQALAADIAEFLARLAITASEIVPVSARDGENVVTRTERLGWYAGPTVSQALDALRPKWCDPGLPLRFPIQDVYKFDERRLLVGRIETGRVAVGDVLLFSPRNNSAKIASIETWPHRPQPSLTASAGQSIAITLNEQIFVERGAVASSPENPPVETDVFRGRIIWFGKHPLAEGQALRVKIATSEVPAAIQSIDKIIDVNDLSKRTAKVVNRNEIAELTIRTRQIVALDDYARSPCTGRFALVDEGGIAGGGIISMEGYADQRPAITVRATNLQHAEQRVSAEERARRNGHAGCVLWLTGLSGSGKSTLAAELHRRLFDIGCQAYVLDGDNIRNGLCANLGFSPEDRAENIRRVGEVAALFSDAGQIAIAAFISPYRSDRDRARQASQGRFHEIYVKAPLEVCENRDPKGLYRKARAGEIPDFTGIGAPYEVPEQPQLVIDTAAEGVERSVTRIFDYVVERVLKSF
jgi:bifunctional enzyme CysN/CysC